MLCQADFESMRPYLCDKGEVQWQEADLIPICDFILYAHVMEVLQQQSQ